MNSRGSKINTSTLYSLTVSQGVSQNKINMYTHYTFTYLSIQNSDELDR